MRYDPRTWGFRQARPVVPGVYLIQIEPAFRKSDRERDGWDVAHVYWSCDGWGSSEPREKGHWRIKTLSGLDYAWSKGTWLKGPIDPTVQIQCKADSQRAPQ